MDPLERLPGNAPVTWAVILIGAATFVAAFVANAPPEVMWSALAFRPEALWARPWTALTYPLVGSGGPLWVLLASYMLWMFGGSLERGWGARGYVVFLALVSAAAALGLWVGAVATGVGAGLAGLAMPLSAGVVAWGTINPRERLMLYFVLPVEARWLAVASAALVLFAFRPFPLGLFALAGPGAAYWYVRSGRYLAVPRRAPARRPGRERPGPRVTLNLLALYRRWRLKRQFDRLMRNVSAADETDRGRLH